MRWRRSAALAATPCCRAVAARMTPAKLKPEGFTAASCLQAASMLQRRCTQTLHTLHGAAASRNRRHRRLAVAAVPPQPRGKRAVGAVHMRQHAQAAVGAQAGRRHARRHGHALQLILRIPLVVLQQGLLPRARSAAEREFPAVQTAGARSAGRPQLCTHCLVGISCRVSLHARHRPHHDATPSAQSKLCCEVTQGLSTSCGPRRARCATSRGDGHRAMAARHISAAMAAGPITVAVSVAIEFESRAG